MLNIDYILKNFDYDSSTGILLRVLTGGQRSKSGTSCNGYLRSGVDGLLTYNHRISWAHYYRDQPPEFIDHIDGDRENNRIDNLRACTLSENQMNRKVNSNSTTGYTGVTFMKNKGRFKATIYRNNKPTYLGLYDTAKEASKAYQKAKDNSNEVV